jgi:hypothetical protein
LAFLSGMDLHAVPLLHIPQPSMPRSKVPTANTFVGI